MFLFKCYRTDATISPSMYCRYTIVDKRKINLIARDKRILSKNDPKTQESNLTDTKSIDLLVRVLENSATSNISKKYREFIHLF
jgi:hypothetical protein